MDIMIKNLAITKLAFCLTVLLGVAYYFYTAVNLWASIGSAVFLVVLWIVYANVTEHVTGKKIETYTQPFSIAGSESHDEFFKSGEFFFNREHCDGGINFCNEGISIKLTSTFIIPWRHIKGITLLEAKGFNAARLFLKCNKNEESKLFVPWYDEFKSQIPESILFTDSRRR